MIEKFQDFFLPEHRFYLDSVYYNRSNIDEFTSSAKMRCEDKINAAFIGDSTVQLDITRTISFDPKALFELSITYGAYLEINPDKNVDWESIDLGNEFRENGMFVLGNLLNRISLLISDITSSYGQTPLITPNTIIEEPIVFSAVNQAED